MKKNGFISTTLIYTFFVVFLLLMVFLLNNYSRTRFLLDEYRYDIKNSFKDNNASDVGVFIKVLNGEDYEERGEVPGLGYYLDEEASYCSPEGENAGTIAYKNGNLIIDAKGKTTCYAYFKKYDFDINLDIYIKDNASTNCKTNPDKCTKVNDVPNSSYKFVAESSSCDNGSQLIFDEMNRSFNVSSTSRTTCTAEFMRRNMDINIYLYKEDNNGTIVDNSGNSLTSGKKYKEVTTIPGFNYIFASYTCEKNNTILAFNSSTYEIDVNSSGQDICRVYFNKEKQAMQTEIIIMQETALGENGITANKKYSRAYSIPGLGYRYAGYRCEDGTTVLSYSGGVLQANPSTSDTVCYAYFEKTSNSVLYNYYIQNSDGSYDKVANLPSGGYVYNTTKSKCENSSTLSFYNGILTADTAGEDTCNIYYDRAKEDVAINVYVWNNYTNDYRLSDVPKGRYIENQVCTNGNKVIYSTDGTLSLESPTPTICDVYFR